MMGLMVAGSSTARIFIRSAPSVVLGRSSRSPSDGRQFDGEAQPAAVRTGRGQDAAMLFDDPRGAFEIDAARRLGGGRMVGALACRPAVRSVAGRQRDTDDLFSSQHAIPV